MTCSDSVYSLNVHIIIHVVTVLNISPDGLMEVVAPIHTYMYVLVYVYLNSRVCFSITIDDM